VLPSSQKLILGLLATITLNAVTFRAYAPFPALMPFLIASWKSFSVRVFGTTCLDHLMAVFSSIFNQANRKVGWVGDDSHVAFGQKFPGVGWCIVMMQQMVLLSPKFGSKSSHILTQLP
jgi:hypothetical protein